MENPEVAGILGDPYALNPAGQRQGPDGPDLSRAAYDPVADSYVAPFIMASINTRVVRRSQALSGHPYGDAFRYDEATLTGSGPMGRIRARMMASMIGTIANAKPGSPVRWVMDTLLPKPGDGPSEHLREKGYFKAYLYGSLPNGQIIKGVVQADGDPGYGATRRMLGESAVCLALDELPDTTGVLTPSVAMGEALYTRLQEKAGIAFSIA